VVAAFVGPAAELTVSAVAAAEVVLDSGWAFRRSINVNNTAAIISGIK